MAKHPEHWPGEGPAPVARDREIRLAPRLSDAEIGEQLLGPAKAHAKACAKKQEIEGRIIISPLSGLLDALDPPKCSSGTPSVNEEPEHVHGVNCLIDTDETMSGSQYQASCALQIARDEDSHGDTSLWRWNLTNSPFGQGGYFRLEDALTAAINCTSNYCLRITKVALDEEDV